MNIVVNGTPHAHHGAATLRDLLDGLGEESPYVVPRVNGKVLDRRDFENVDISDGDQVDLLYIMGGGQKTRQAETTAGKSR